MVYVVDWVVLISTVRDESHVSVRNLKKLVVAKSESGGPGVLPRKKFQI